MAIRYKPVLGILYLILGAVVFLLGVWLMSLTGIFQVGVLLGPLIVFIGAQTLRRPYAEIGRWGVSRLALVGSGTRRTELATGERLVIDGGRMYVLKPDGSRRSARVAGWLAHSADWQAAAAALAAGQL